MNRRRPDMRRDTPQPPWDGPEVRHTPGMARDLLRQIGPLLAEDGITVDAHGDIVGELPDMDTLQQALARAVERQNLALFTPVGVDRDLATAALRAFIAALAADDTISARHVLDQVRPESPDHTHATVAGVTGVALGLLDEWLTGNHPHAPHTLAARTRLPAGHWDGERAAVDVLALAAKNRAFRSLDKLSITHGGLSLLHGSALALAAATITWAHQLNHPTDTITDAAVR